MHVFDVGQEPRFCFVCGHKVRLRYPGGNPENGPAELYCSADDSHQSIDEVVERAGSLGVRELAERVQEVAYNGNFDPYTMPTGAEQMVILQGARALVEYAERSEAYYEKLYPCSR